MIINAEFLGGTDIEIAAKEAINFRHKTGADVKFIFNGVEIFVCRNNQTVKIISDEYDHAIKRTPTKHDIVQALNPVSHHYVLIDRSIGQILKHGRTSKPYKNVPIVSKDSP